MSIFNMEIKHFVQKKKKKLDSTTDQTVHCQNYRPDS